MCGAAVRRQRRAAAAVLTWRNESVVITGSLLPHSTHTHVCRGNTPESCGPCIMWPIRRREVCTVT